MTYIEQLQFIQVSTGYTQQDLANKLQITTSALSRWINKRAIPRQSAINQIARVYSEVLQEQDQSMIMANKIFEGMLLDDFRLLRDTQHDEAILKNVASLIDSNENTAEHIYNLLIQIPRSDRSFDWNVGSILQHCDSLTVLDMFRRVKDVSIYRNSMGLAWLFGELNLKDPEVINFLESIVSYSDNSDAWWRAAFSLEQLSVGNAVNLLKTSLRIEHLRDIDYYLTNIQDKRSVISILILSTVDNIEQVIYPRLRKIFLNSDDAAKIINCSWLIGRLNLMDDSMVPKLADLINHDNYELRYYTFFALQNNANETLRPLLETALSDKDPLIRKMACRAIRNLGNESSIVIIEKTLLGEKNYAVIAELSKTLYALRNPLNRAAYDLERKVSRNENGMIIDESDKWYTDASTYNTFSEAEDPHNVCFNLIQQATTGLELHNPIDLATGTGRALKQIINKFSYTGTLYGIDSSEQMCNYLAKSIKRERNYTHNIEIINSTIEEMTDNGIKSNFIISSFGFPSKFSNVERCMSELRAVYSMLIDNGVFITLGWDETFNDELNEIWFRYVPDTIRAQNFEEWRRKRAASIRSPRNCNLTWLKRGLNVPLQFASIQDSASVMGYLFGRDAAHEIIETNRLEWSMSLGVTMDTKEDIGKIIEKYEARS